MRVFIATTGNGIARAVQDRVGHWTVECALEGNDVRSLAVDSSNMTTVYAGTQGNGVLRSDDCGKTWQPAGLGGRIVKSIAVSPVEPETVYAGTKPAHVFVSRDRGAHWTELAGFRRIRSRWFWFSPAELPFSAYVQAVGVAPTNPNIIIAGIEAGAVVRSDDGGNTWSGHRTGALRDCHTLFFHPTRADWVYECGGGGAAVSRDAGMTFIQPKQGLDRNYGWACAADPERPEVWYASLSTGPFQAHGEGNAQAYIYRAIGGAPFEKLSGGLPQPLDYMPYALITDPGAAGHLYAGLSNGDIWHTVDYGDTWQQLPVHLKGIQRTMVGIP